MGHTSSALLVFTIIKFLSTATVSSAAPIDIARRSDNCRGYGYAGQVGCALADGGSGGIWDDTFHARAPAGAAAGGAVTTHTTGASSSVGSGSNGPSDIEARVFGIDEIELELD